MNCPYCDFKFEKLMVNSSELPTMAPTFCERCCQISLVEDGSIRGINSEELEEVKRSPAYEQFIRPALEFIKRQKRQKVVKLYGQFHGDLK